MKLNDLQPAPGSRKSAKRVGRGIGSGLGKTAGRGHKGQKSRAGGYHKLGFEGGQMPLQRRLPKFGFRARVSRFSAEVRLSELAKCPADAPITLATLVAASVVPAHTRQAKVIASGAVERDFQLKGLRVTPGARAAIEAAGGSIED